MLTILHCFTVAGDLFYNFLLWNVLLVLNSVSMLNDNEMLHVKSSCNSEAINHIYCSVIGYGFVLSAL